MSKTVQEDRMTKTQRAEKRRQAEEKQAEKKAKRDAKGGAKWAAKVLNQLMGLAVGQPPLQLHGIFVPMMTTTERHRKEIQGGVRVYADPLSF